MPDPPVNPRKPHLWWSKPYRVNHGCTPCSLACRECWSATQTAKYRALWKLPNGIVKDGKFTGMLVVASTQSLTRPLRTQRREVYSAWNELFHRDMPDEAIDTAFVVAALCPQSDFIFLTKRPERAREYLSADGLMFRLGDLALTRPPIPYPRSITAKATRWANIGNALQDGSHPWPLPNVILGVTCESDRYLSRVEELVKTPAAVRFVNAHLLGPLDLSSFMVPEGHCLHCGAAGSVHQGMHWTCPDGEPNMGEPCGPVSKGSIDAVFIECNRPFHGDPAEWWGWCESLVAQATADVAVWVKQGPRANGSVTHDIAEFPEFAQRREFPQAKGDRCEQEA